MATRRFASAAAIALTLACSVGVAGASAASPTIERQWVTGVTTNNATLRAAINPNGEQTYYELQIDTTGNFRFFQNTSCPIGIAPMLCLQVIEPGDPLPPGLVQPPEFALAPGGGGQSVSVSLGAIGATLQPETTYHYRVIAAHGMGPVVEGPDQTFVTPPATSAPTIDNKWVSDVTSENATLHAQINPNGLLTRYKLQLDTTGNFSFFQTDSCQLYPPEVGCATVIVPGEPQPPGLVQPPESTLQAGYGSQHVSVNMASIGAILQPGTTYHYRVIAASGVPFVFGQAQTFTTPLTEELPISDEFPPEELPDEIEPPNDGKSEPAGAPPGPTAAMPLVDRSSRRCAQRARRKHRGDRLKRRAATRRCAHRFRESDHG